MTSRKNTTDLLKASYLPQKQAADLMAKKGYTYDKNLSNMETKVFVDKNNKPVVTHRGSTRLSDWRDDLLLGVGLGKMTHRYKQAERMTKRVEEKYGKSDAVGHSLGGWLSENTHHGGDTVTYNKAVGLGDIGKKKTHNQIDYKTSGDIVSVGSNLQKTNTVMIPNVNKSSNFFVNAYNAHDLNNIDEYFPNANN